MAHPVLISFPNTAQLMNFLVVDDNQLLNRFLTTYLRDKGHRRVGYVRSGCLKR